jgi:hypothetical protein
VGKLGPVLYEDTKKEQYGLSVNADVAELLKNIPVCPVVELEEYVDEGHVTVFPLPDLSTHDETVAPTEGLTPVPAGSAPSNHNAHPEILRGVETGDGTRTRSPHFQVK